MTFISYAQNFEDVMLWRALKHVDEGFYIDVGANDPDDMSVTRAFYEANWRGINVEPVRGYFDLLQAARPRDINLCLGAGAAEGMLELFNIPDSGLATSVPAIAQSHREAGWHVEPQQMTVRTLAQICADHVQGPIHFLKIDVEGAERDVLSGMDFQRWRPWIVVVEATVPMSQKQVHEQWEDLLLVARYEPTYFDGLNRYYLAQEHADLRPAFDAPPNPFDHYISSDTHQARIQYAQAQDRLKESQALELSQRARQEALQAELGQAEAEKTSLAQRVQQLEQDHVRLQHESAAELARAIERAELAGDQVVLATERAELAGNQVVLATERAELAGNQVVLATERAELAGDQVVLATERAELAEHRVYELMSSSSWRLTGPLRRLTRLAKKVIGRAAPIPSTTAPTQGARAPETPASSRTSEQTSVKTAFKSALRRSIKTTLSTRTVRAIIANPSLRGRVTSVLYRYPALDARVRALVHQARTEPVPAHQSRPSDQVSMDDSQLRTMPRSARRIALAIQRSSKKPE